MQIIHDELILNLKKIFPYGHNNDNLSKYAITKSYKLTASYSEYKINNDNLRIERRCGANKVKEMIKALRELKMAQNKVNELWKINSDVILQYTNLTKGVNNNVKV